MPLMTLKTNVDLSDLQLDSLLPQCSALVSKLLGKPESYVMVAIEGGISMSFAASTDALAFIELKSLGLPDNRTTELSRGLCKFINESLGIPSDRIYIQFSSPARHHWGWDEKTF